MSEADAMTDRKQLLHAFRRLGDELGNKRVRAEVALAGGAVVTVLFDTEQATRKVDALIEGNRPLVAAAHRVADELRLPPDWLNKAVAAYVGAKPDPRRLIAFEHPNFTVYAAAMMHLLAIKARTAQAHDLGDVQVLASDLGMDSAADVLAVVERFFRNDPISEHAAAAIEDLFN